MIYANKALSDQKFKKDIHIKYKNLDKRKFKEAFENIDWNQLLAVYCNDPNISLDIFLKTVNSILDRHVPLIRVNKKIEKTNKKPRTTRDIFVSIKKKNKVYNKFCQAKHPGRTKLSNEIFKKCRNILANLTIIIKVKHYKNYFQENKNNLCKTWQGIKQIILIKKTNNKQLNDLKVNNMIVNGSKSIASKFKEFFGSVAKEIDKKIPKSKRTYTDYLKTNLNSLLLNPVTESEI